MDEVLIPLPAASEVINKLLQWIDRCDAASTQGRDKPLFATPTGEPIFPDEEERWWLTDVSSRKSEEAKGDEDGPPSEVDQDDDALDPEACVDDEDPVSEPSSDGEIPSSGGLPVGAPNAHEPSVQWSGAKSGCMRSLAALMIVSACL